MEVKSYYFHYQLLKTLAAEVVIVKRSLLLSDWAVWTLSVKKYSYLIKNYYER